MSLYRELTEEEIIDRDKLRRLDDIAYNESFSFGFQEKNFKRIIHRNDGFAKKVTEYKGFVHYDSVDMHQTFSTDIKLRDYDESNIRKIFLNSLICPSRNEIRKNPRYIKLRKAGITQFKAICECNIHNLNEYSTTDSTLNNVIEYELSYILILPNQDEYNLAMLLGLVDTEDMIY